MFEFTYGAWLLILIPILILLYVFRYKDRKKIWGIFQQNKRWSESINLSNSEIFAWRKFLIIIAFILTIIALMRPQYGENYQTIEREGRQIFFIMDTSLSMLAEDGLKTRLDLAKYHVQQLLPKISDDFFSIIPYSSTAYTYLPLTSDMSAATLFIDDIFVGMIGSSGSNIINALKVVSGAINKNSIAQSATLIIFSDGEFSTPLDQNEISKLFKGKSIESVVVGIGSPQGEPIPLRDENGDLIKYKKDQNGKIVLSKRIDNELQNLASLINGIVIDGDPNPLIAEKIYSHLTTIETKNLEEKQVITKIDRYHWLLLIALILLLVEISIPKINQKFIQKSLLVFLLLFNSQFLHGDHPGNDAYNNQNYSEAENEFEKAINKSPENGKIMYNLGNTFYKQGEYNKAIQAYNESLQFLPKGKQVEPFYNIGTSYLKQNDLKNAIKAYQEVLKRDPSHLQTKQNLELALRLKNMPPQQQQSSDGDNDEENDSEESQSASQGEGSENEESDEQQSVGANEDQEEDQDSEQSDGNISQEELSEQQIQALVDYAEKEAREKRKQKQELLFESSEW